MCIREDLAKHRRNRVEIVAKTEGRCVSETTDAAPQGAILELEGAMSGGVIKSLEEVVESNKFHADGMHASEMEGQQPPPCETALAVETVEYESPTQVGAEFSQSVSVPLAPAMLEPLADSSITTVSETAWYGSLTEQNLETSPDEKTWCAGLGQNNAELSPGVDASAVLPPAPLDSNEDVELSPSVDASELVPQALHDEVILHGDLGREDADPSLSFSASALLPPAPLESREDVELSQSVDASELEGQQPPPCETALAVETVEYESPTQVGAEFSQSVSVPLAPAMLEPLADSSITTVSETAWYGSLTEQNLETSPDEKTWCAGLGQNNAELSPGVDASAVLPPAPLDSNEDVELSPSVDASELVPQALHDEVILHGDLGREDADPSLSFSASALLPPAPLESREDVELSPSVDATELLPQALHVTLARDVS